jgi:hypothetical protein
MSQKIHKYLLKIRGKNIIKLPIQHEILKLTTHNNKIYVYALINNEEDNYIEKEIFLCWTNEEIQLSPRNKYINNVTLTDGNVIHGFEIV